MNIAMMVRGYIPVPGPPDMINAPLVLAKIIAEGLAKRGHKVDFYAPIGSELDGVEVKSCNLRALAKNRQDFLDLFADHNMMSHYVPSLWDSFMAEAMFKEAAEGTYDVLHFHHPEPALPVARMFNKLPVIYTLHDPIYDWQRELFELYQTDNEFFVSISNNQRRDAPDLPYISTVYNGIYADDYPFSDEPEDYLLFAGRVVPEKGVKEAIQIARKSHHRLLIVGSTYPDSQDYFEQYVKPHLDDQILYLGYVEQEQMARYYQKAKALVTPIQWEEPFGMTTIEAMASGTPVIALRRGAAKELIVNKKTGFLADSISEMVEAVHKVDQIKRSDCRAHVAKNFSAEKMIDGYEAAFEEVIRRRRKLSRYFVKTQLKKVPRQLRSTTQKRRLRKIIEASKRQR